MKKTVLGLDPGSKNFGAALVSFDPANGRVQVERSAVLKSPVHDLTRAGSEGKAFLSELGSWASRADGIVAERFQSRGLRGATVECVSFMLGLTSAGFPTHPLMLLTASTWKNVLQRRFAVDLKEIYHEYRFDIAAHQIDSAFIAIYGLEKSLGMLDYQFYSVIEQAIKRNKHEST